MNLKLIAVQGIFRCTAIFVGLPALAFIRP
jgi:hypothetical protein